MSPGDETGVEPERGFRIWDGVYDDFPAEDPQGVFADGAWVDKHGADVAAAISALDALPTDAACSTATLVHEYPLAVLASLAADGLGRPLRVLDFGGGAAASYPAVAGALPEHVPLEFHVAELPALVARGRELYTGHPTVHFHEGLPDVAPGWFDIVHAAAALQYVRDWQGLLARFARYEPEWLAFGHLLAGPIRTFVTRQNVYGRQVPVRFLALTELLAVLDRLGYRLVHRSLMVRTILGREQPLPTEHFPPGYRLRYGCNLIFRRTATVQEQAS